MSGQNYFHSVTLDREKCHGCINCVKRCPTEAIRVRGGKAEITTARCIDCGECIRICPHHAKKASFDPLSILERYRYTVALPAPALYGQFNNLEDPNLLLAALLRMGFDRIFEVARAAELVSDATRKYMQRPDLIKPVISSACPAVLRLIRVRFPELIPNILPLHAPMEIAARMAKTEAARETGLPPQEIGAIFISPCPAKVTASKMLLGGGKSAVDGVLAIREVYPLLASLMSKVESTELTQAGRMGISWGSSGGEAAAVLRERYLAADGIENVISVLENLEDEKFYGLDFVELNACPGGCVGGVLNVENPYIAKVKLKQIRRYSPVSCNRLPDEDLQPYRWEEPLSYEPVLELDSNLSVAMEKLQRMRKIESRLYGLDCGSCGAPSCKALAEDVVRGIASEEACIFKLRDEVHTLAQGLNRLAQYMPQAPAKEEEP